MDTADKVGDVVVDEAVEAVSFSIFSFSFFSRNSHMLKYDFPENVTRIPSSLSLSLSLSLPLPLHLQLLHPRISQQLILLLPLTMKPVFFHCN
jgi:hypothetical protein